MENDSRGSREHKTVDGREAGGIGELLAGKPRARDRRGELQGFSGDGMDK